MYLEKACNSVRSEYFCKQFAEFVLCEENVGQNHDIKSGNTFFKIATNFR